MAGGAGDFIAGAQCNAMDGPDGETGKSGVGSLLVVQYQRQTAGLETVTSSRSGLHGRPGRGHAGVRIDQLVQVGPPKVESDPPVGLQARSERVVTPVILVSISRRGGVSPGSREQAGVRRIERRIDRLGKVIPRLNEMHTAVDARPTVYLIAGIGPHPLLVTRTNVGEAVVRTQKFHIRLCPPSIRRTEHNAGERCVVVAR